MSDHFSPEAIRALHAAKLADLIAAAEYYADCQDAWDRTAREDDYLEMLRANLTLVARHEALTGADLGFERDIIHELARSECDFDLENECWLDDDGNLVRSKPVWGETDHRYDLLVEDMTPAHGSTVPRRVL